MAIEDDTLTEIVQNIWRTTLELSATRSSLGSTALHLESTVEIVGAWDGTVGLGLPEPLARIAAAGLFMIDADDATPDDMHDAVGELSNQIAGSIKSVLPSPSRLGLPQVQPNWGSEKPDERGDARKFWFHTNDAPFVVMLHPRADGASTDAPAKESQAC